MRPGLFAERFTIIQGALADASGAGGLATPAVNMRDAVSATLCFMKAAGTAGDDPTITIQQGDGISSGNLANGKNLVAIDRVDTKRHASAIPKTYTEETQAAAATWTSATLAEELGHALITIYPDELDVDNGFHAVKATIADVGTNGQYGVLFWIVESKYTPPLDLQSDA